MFATAPRHLLLFGNVHLHGRESCPLMRAVAKRLAFGTSTRTPKIRARLDALNDGRFLCNDGLAHKISSNDQQAHFHSLEQTRRTEPPDDAAQCFESSGPGSLSLVNHQTTRAGPKQSVTPIGMPKILQKTSISCCEVCA